MSIESSAPVLVTGATGNVGKQVVQLLVEAGIRTRAVSRNPEMSRGSSLIEPVKADLSDPATLMAALTGVKSVFLMLRALASPTKPIVDLLKGCGVTKIVFLSSSAIEDDRAEQRNPIAKFHSDAEENIEHSIDEWTFLRPGAFAANALSWWAPQLRKSDTLRWPLAEAASAPIHEKDIAAVAVRCLLDSEHAGNRYSLTGGSSLTQKQQLDTIGNVLGRNLQFYELTANEARQELQPEIPPFVIERLLQILNSSVGKPAVTTDTVRRILGSEPRTFAEWTADHAVDFSEVGHGTK